MGPKGRWGNSESNSWEEMLQYKREIQLSESCFPQRAASSYKAI